MIWYVLWMVAGIGAGIVIYNRAGQGGESSYNSTPVLVGEAVWFGLGAFIGLTMLWIIAFLLIAFSGFTMFGNRH